MRIVINAVVVLILTTGLVLPAGARAPSQTWMREYVELRVRAMTERALGAADSRQSGTRIVGGTVAAPSSNPFQVALLDRRIRNNASALFCGGSLVRPNVVVTAAHCSDFVIPSTVEVLTGARRLDGSGTRRQVQDIIVYPTWNPITFDNDVAVWILASSASGIPLARLAGTDPATGTTLLATGWGDTTDSEMTSEFPINLMEVKIPLVSRANCNDANSYDGAVTGSMICAGLDEGGKDTCQGDSGGPLTRRLDTRFKVLTGITSWGEGCADRDRFGVYTRVSRFRDWIISQFP
jgi:secreted trypsin-like serine protease